MTVTNNFASVDGNKVSIVAAGTPSCPPTPSPSIYYADDGLSGSIITQVFRCPEFALAPRAVTCNECNEPSPVVYGYGTCYNCDINPPVIESECPNGEIAFGTCSGNVVRFKVLANTGGGGCRQVYVNYGEDTIADPTCGGGMPFDILDHDPFPYYGYITVSGVHCSTDLPKPNRGWNIRCKAIMCDTNCGTSSEISEELRKYDGKVCN